MSRFYLKFGITLLWNVLLCMALLPIAAAADGAKLKDPTRPESFAQPVVRASGKTRVVLPRLSSVLIGAERRLAIIDGHLMAEGDVSNGIRVQRIKSDHVDVALADSTVVTLMLDSPGLHKEVR